jgi:hypothetical protein
MQLSPFMARVELDGQQYDVWLDSHGKLAGVKFPGIPNALAIH